MSLVPQDQGQETGCCAPGTDCRYESGVPLIGPGDTELFALYVLRLSEHVQLVWMPGIHIRPTGFSTPNIPLKVMKVAIIAAAAILLQWTRF